MLSCTKYTPSELLCSYVVHYWTTTAECSGDIFVVPDACPELLFNFDADFSTVIDGKRYGGMDGGICGQFSRPAVLNARRGSRTLWVKLQPWTLSLLFGIPVTEMNDRILSAGETGDAEFMQLVRRVTHSAGAAEAIRIIEEFLLTRIYKENPGNDLLSSVVRKIFQTRGKTTIGDLASVHGVGIRQLQYVFRERIGLSPSYYRKEVRVKSISLLLMKNKPVRLSSLADNWGYTDHSHLLRDFKSIVQLSPFQYRKKILDQDIALLDLEAEYT